MTEESRLREEMVRIAKSLFDRGFTSGSTGNLSAKLPDGGFLVTPTGSSLGFLDPARISKLGSDGSHLSGDRPTKEMPMHMAFYRTRPETGAVVHLHSTYATAWSMLPKIDPDDALPLLTPYSLMLLGQVKLLPFFLPGDAAMAGAIEALDGRHKAVLLANHGPVVADKDLWSATFAIEEFEETAKLAFLTKALDVQGLGDQDRAALIARFGLAR